MQKRERLYEFDSWNRTTDYILMIESRIKSLKYSIGKYKNKEIKEVSERERLNAIKTLTLALEKEEMMAERLGKECAVGELG